MTYGLIQLQAFFGITVILLFLMTDAVIWCLMQGLQVILKNDLVI